MTSSLPSVNPLVYCADQTEGRKRGRPPKRGEPFVSIHLSLPPSMIEEMQAEQSGQNFDSLSAVARVAICDYLRRVGKRRLRDSEGVGGE